MDPSALIPATESLQVPWGWFQFLLVVTLFLHVLAMNVMLGTAFIAFANLLRRSGEPDPLSREISGKIPFTIAFTINFGVAPLLFVQVLYGHFLYTSSVLMANFWILVIFLLMAGYYLAYIFKYNYEPLHGGRVLVIGLATAVMLAVAFFMSSNFTLMQRPEAWTRYFDRPAGLLLNFGDPTFIPRFLHFVTAAVAVGGLSFALLYEFRHRRGNRDAAPLVRSGCYWFSFATIVNFGFGFWFFGSLRPEVFDVSTGSGILAAVLLLAGIVLGALSVISAMQFRVMRALATILPTIFLMILIRDLVRAAYLKPWFSVSELEVVPQYSPFLVFLLFLAGGAFLIGWMLKLAWRTIKAGEVQS
ncbi:MAG: hypothetical protein RBR09_03705 [Desulfobulbaceae bacterium]|jgi:hypothetical protein|nr:hypothetical protein [Desulfobulbaceae bacterium]MDY0350338.1 hypothetical protein [Desulfobulbaceae bacterium]